MSTLRPRPYGFALIGALFLIVVLGALSVFLIGISTAQRYTTTLSLLGNRAHAAAQSAIEWAIQRAVSAPAALNCGGAAVTFTLQAGSSGSYDVAVSCTVTATTEGGTSINIYALTAQAEQGSLGNADYISRTVRATVTN
jgi:MSHA biogenesis protein MshP